MSAGLILAGDVGGTKTRLALWGQDGRLVREESLPSRQFESFLDLILAFEPPAALAGACFGVAGPVLDGVCRTTNLPWTLGTESLSLSLAAPVWLLNDLEATGYGMLALPAERWVDLNPDAEALAPMGHMAILAAGTGLGEALALWDGERHQLIPGEGGHASFSPVGAQQEALLQWMRQQLDGHVSWERVLSGPGLVHCYEFLRDAEGMAESAWLRDQIETARGTGGDVAALIGHHAVAGDDPLCLAAAELFATCYGNEAANLALKVLARGGVLIGGGIAPKLLPVLQRGAMLSGFVDKGRFSSLLRRLPLRVCTEPDAALLGAAAYARKRLRA